MPINKKIYVAVESERSPTWKQTKTYERETQRDRPNSRVLATWRSDNNPSISLHKSEFCQSIVQDLRESNFLSFYGCKLMAQWNQWRGQAPGVVCLLIDWCNFGAHTDCWPRPIAKWWTRAEKQRGDRSRNFFFESFLFVRYLYLNNSSMERIAAIKWNVEKLKAKWRVSKPGKLHIFSEGMHVRTQARAAHTRAHAHPASRSGARTAVACPLPRKTGSLALMPYVLHAMKNAQTTWHKKRLYALLSALHALL